jgi:hypothetical protein
MSWQTHLHELQQKYYLWKAQHHEDAEQQVTEVMKERFPGEYQVVEYYNPNRGIMDLKVVFEDTKKELVWKVKYSSGQ